LIFLLPILAATNPLIKWASEFAVSLCGPERFNPIETETLVITEDGAVGNILGYDWNREEYLVLMDERYTRCRRYIEEELVSVRVIKGARVAVKGKAGGRGIVEAICRSGKVLVRFDNPINCNMHVRLNRMLFDAANLRVIDVAAEVSSHWVRARVLIPRWHLVGVVTSYYPRSDELRVSISHNSEIIVSSRYVHLLDYIQLVFI